MNFYPTELRTPPLPLVAFVGCPELHKEVATFFSQTLRPPLVVVGAADANEQLLARLFGTQKTTPAAPDAPQGILKADWFMKHRQRKCAVALALVTRADLEGDPIVWGKMLAQLKTVRDASQQRSAGFLMVVVQDLGAGELPPDRVQAVCHNLSIDARSIQALSKGSDDSTRAKWEQDLKALGRLVLEQTWVYYRANAQRIQEKFAERAAARPDGTLPEELNTRCAFKLAVMAEFRQDWTTAVSQYQAAYSHVSAVPVGQPVSCQRLAEVTRVAEQVHYKIVMLLLHQQRLEEAVAQLRTHVSRFFTPPGPLPPAALAAHLAWVSRQYQAAAEMVRSNDNALAMYKDCQPAYLQLAAAQVSIKRRKAAEAARAARAGSPITIDTSSVKRGPFTGQVVLRTDEGTMPLSEEDYLLWLESEEAKTQHTQVTLELLNSALLLFKDTRHERMRTLIGVLMAQEHLNSNNLIAARKLLLQVAYTYRRDGWEQPLAAVLSSLRDCTQRLKQPREHIAYTLELAALPTDLLEAAAARSLTRAAVAGLVTGATAIKNSIIKKERAAVSGSPDRDSRPPTPPSGQGAPGPRMSIDDSTGSPTHSGSRFDYVVEFLDLREAQRRAREKETSSSSGANGVPVDASRASVADLLLRHQQQDFGWWRVVTVAGGFVPSPSDAPFLDLRLYLRNNLPITLPLLRVELVFTDEEGEWSALAQPGPPCVTTPVVTAGTRPPPMPPPSVMSSLQSSRSTSPLSNGRRGDDGPSHRPATADILPSSSLSDLEGMVTERAVSAEAAGTSGRLSLHLRPQQWRELCCRAQPRCVGRLRCEAAILTISDHCTVTWRLSSLPVTATALGALQTCSFPPRLEAAGQLQGNFAFNLQHVGPMPKLQVEASALALVGEWSPVSVTVTLVGALRHCELEFSLKATDGMLPQELQLMLDDGSQLVPLSVDSQRMQLSDLPAGCTQTVRLWLQAPRRCRVTLTATLFAPAIIMQTAELAFEDPFAHTARITAESGTHTLSAPHRATGGANAGCVPLTIGQPVVVTLVVRAAQACCLELLEAGIDVASDSGLQVMCEVQGQLAAGPATLHQSDLFTLLLQACPTLIATAVCIGTLRLKWRRRGAAAVTPPSGPLQPPPEVTTCIELPTVSTQESILSVRTTSPPQATAGIAFSYAVQIQNFMAAAQELHVSIADSGGFVLNGERSQALTLAPMDTVTIMWYLVAHMSGHLTLPPVRVAAAQHNCTLSTHSPRVYIMPF